MMIKKGLTAEISDESVSSSLDVLADALRHLKRNEPGMWVLEFHHEGNSKVQPCTMWAYATDRATFDLRDAMKFDSERDAESFKEQHGLRFFSPIFYDHIGDDGRTE